VLPDDKLEVMANSAFISQQKFHVGVYAQQLLSWCSQDKKRQRETILLLDLDLHHPLLISFREMLLKHCRRQAL